MQPLTTRLTQARRALADAEFILIGAGAGFSAAAGLAYGGKRFSDNFQPFIARYGMTDMYSAGFYPFEREEQKWAYWARHVWVNRFAPPATALYRQLFGLVVDKNYFVLTTNVDGQFAKAGFAAEHLFAVQGDYAELQCAKACHTGLYDNRAQVEQWLAQTTKTLEIPTALLPRCPVCGGKMAMHLRTDQYFIENEQWHQAQARYAAFAEDVLRGKTVYLELGVGYNTPTIIRYPFEQMTYRNPQATLIRLNRDDAQGFAETAERTIAFSEDTNEIMARLG